MIDVTARRQVAQYLEKHEADVRRYLREWAVESIYMPRAPEHAVPANAVPELYDFVASTIGNRAIVYLEFGVHHGRSMRRIAERFPHPEAQFFGFDSFQGLPETWGAMAPGAFSTLGGPPPMSDGRIRLVEGWFQNTVPEFLTNLTLHDTPVLIHFDADLYSSTLFLLTSLWHHIPQYYFVFDEFMSEEIVALHDFWRAYPTVLEFHSQTNAGGYPAQIFGSLRKVRFEPRQFNCPV
jgi:hypothetical protein